MASEFWDKLAEFSLDAGLKLLKAQREEVSQQDKREMADVIMMLAINNACDVARVEGLGTRLSFAQFLEIAAIFIGHSIAFCRRLSGVSISLSDSSLNVVRECAGAFQGLQQAGQVSVSSALVKQ